LPAVEADRVRQPLCGKMFHPSMDAESPAQGSRNDYCRRAQSEGDADAKPGGRSAAIEKNEEEEIGDKRHGAGQDIGSLETLEFDRAADGPVGGIDTRCHITSF